MTQAGLTNSASKKNATATAVISAAATDTAEDDKARARRAIEDEKVQ
jgi:hypothetical protein